MLPHPSFGDFDLVDGINLGGGIEGNDIIDARELG